MAARAAKPAETCTVMIDPPGTANDCVAKIILMRGVRSRKTARRGHSARMRPPVCTLSRCASAVPSHNAARLPKSSARADASGRSSRLPMPAACAAASRRRAVSRPDAQSAASHAPDPMPQTANGSVCRAASSSSTPTPAAPCTPVPVSTTPSCTRVPPFLPPSI